MLLFCNLYTYKYSLYMNRVCYIRNETTTMDDKCALVSIGLGRCATPNVCSAKVCLVIEKVSACFNWLNDVEGVYKSFGHATLVYVYECLCNCHTSPQKHQQRFKSSAIRRAKRFAILIIKVVVVESRCDGTRLDRVPRPQPHQRNFARITNNYIGINLCGLFLCDRIQSLRGM